SFLVDCSRYFIMPPCGHSSFVLLFSSATNSVCCCNQAFPEFLPCGVYITNLSLSSNSLELLSKLAADFFLLQVPYLTTICSLGLYMINIYIYIYIYISSSSSSSRFNVCSHPA